MHPNPSGAQLAPSPTSPTRHTQGIAAQQILCISALLHLLTRRPAQPEAGLPGRLPALLLAVAAGSVQGRRAGLCHCRCCLLPQPRPLRPGVTCCVALGLWRPGRPPEPAALSPWVSGTGSAAPPAVPTLLVDTVVADGRSRLVDGGAWTRGCCGPMHRPLWQPAHPPL